MSWIDSLSDNEVKALYKYKQQGVDALSDDEVRLMYPHKDKLQVLESQKSDVGEKTTGLGVTKGGVADYARAGLELTGHVLSGAVGGLLAPIPTAIQAANEYAGGRGKDFNFEKQLAENMSAMTYEPRTETGKELAAPVGQFMNDVVIPASQVMHGIPYASTLAPVVGAIGKNLGKAKPPSRISAALEELKAPETKPPVNANLEFFKQEALRKQQEAEAARIAQGQRPITVTPEGVAVPADRPVQLANMERQSPMERVASELGATEPLPLNESPMSRMAQDLVTEKETPVQRSIQEGMDARQAAMEADVLKQTTLERNAAERQRQEAAPTGAAEHAAEVAKMTQEQLAAHQEHLQTLQEQINRAKETAASEAELARIAEAQRVLDERQVAVEFEVKKQATLDFNAAERARREAADMFPGPNGARERARYEAISTAADRLRETLRKEAEIDKAWNERPYDPERVAERRAEEVQREQTRAERFDELQSLEQQLRDMSEKPPKTGQGPKTREAQREAMRSKFNKQMGAVRVDWGNKDKASAVSNVPGFEKLKSVGHAMIESPAEAVELAKKTGDVEQGVIGKAFNYLTKGGEYLKARVNNPVVHFGVDRMLQGKDLANAAISQKLHGDYLSVLRKLPKNEYVDLHELLSTADMMQKEITPEFMQRHNFSEAMQDAVRAHQGLMKDALEQINKARESVGKPEITAREAYSAMSIRGAYRKVVTRLNEKGEPEVVGVISSDMLKGNVGWTLSKIEEFVKQQNPEYSFGPLQDRTSLMMRSKGSPHDAFTDTLKLLGKDNPHIAEFLDTLREVAKEDSKHYMGMDKHTLQKKGVFGTEGRKQWLSPEENAKQFFDNQATYLENALSWGHLAEAAKDVNEVLRTPEVFEKHPNAVKLTEDYMQQALGINRFDSAKVAEALVNIPFKAAGLGPSFPREALRLTKQTINTTLLSFSHVFLGMQLLQAPAVLPGLTAFLRSYGAAPKSTMFTLGLGHFVDGNFTLMKAVAGKELSSFEQQALAYAKKNHIYADDMIEHSTSTQKTLGYRVSKVTQAPMAVVEKSTRAQVYMALVNIMKDSGITPKQGLFQQAHRFTDMAMNRMDSLEKPQMYEALGPIGSAAYNLASFKHNELSRWSMYADEIIRSKNPVPLLTQMATTLVMAGTIGLPFFSAAAALYDKITDAMGAPRSLLMDVMEASESVAETMPMGKYTLSHGLLSQATGADISRRMGMGEVLPNNMLDAALPGASKLVDMASSAGKALANPTKPEYREAAAYHWAPPMAQGPMDVALFQEGDLALSKNPEKLKTQVRRTDMDVLMRKIGLVGMNESTEKAREYELKVLDQRYNDARMSAMNNMAQDIRRGRDMSESIQKYIKAQGDPNTLNRDISAIAEKLSMSPQEANMLKDAASKSITRTYSLERRMR